MTVVNITDARNTSYELRLQHSKKYEVTVFAWNYLGRSEASKAWEVTTAQCKYILYILFVINQNIYAARNFQHLKFKRKFYNKTIGFRGTE